MGKEKKVRFNGMDAFIILVIAAIIAAGAYLLLGRGTGASSSAEKNVTVRTVVELAGEEEGYADLIKVGDIVMVGEKDKAATTVEKVEVEPAKTTGYDILNGKVLRSEVPNQYDIKVTLVAEGTESDKAIEVNSIPFRVGQQAVLFSQGWSNSGYVIGLSTDNGN